MQSFPFRGFQNHNNPYYMNTNKQEHSNFNMFSNNSKNFNGSDESKKAEENITFSSTCSSKNGNQRNQKFNCFFNNIPFNFDSSSIIGDCSSPVIEIMGIKLYMDDILILILLFILYKEDVKDEMLYISLILLLLS